MGTPPRLTAANADKGDDDKPSAKVGQSRTSGRLSADSIGWYLSTIGRVPLLTAAEEIELAHHVQGMKVLQALPPDTLTRRQHHQIRMGTRARTRMMAATCVWWSAWPRNIRTRVSI